MLKVLCSILAGEIYFSFLLLFFCRKISSDGEKILSVVKMASTDYERETCLAAKIESKSSVKIALLRVVR